MQQFASAITLGVNPDDTDYITLMIYGPQGAHKGAYHLSIIEARDLSTKITNALKILRQKAKL